MHLQQEISKLFLPQSLSVVSAMMEFINFDELPLNDCCSDLPDLTAPAPNGLGLFGRKENRQNVSTKSISLLFSRGKYIVKNAAKKVS